MKTNIKGLNEAVEEYNDNINAVRIYFDKEALNVWAIAYPDLNNWEEYHNNAVVQVASKPNAPFTANYFTLSENELEELCENQLI